ncbi:class I SAM-dependent methyltransferase [Mesorhizobium sp. M6A.T.Ce.TU.016.01.1.1]|uniref:class I SAM-dependent methyltransferase n=1 Tax=Mesorhizobium sp. M6A.T.Ce.TU.016.01.1.1 TaxID=2496783 RepID=UPI001AECC013|nr:class I SAM-dependent methyltransferase [Mesorhizobium sp. M6A.T.Ce.TU.016.01.1.1]
MVKASDSKPVAVDAYVSFAKRYDALAPSKPHNALYERPASFELLGEVTGLDILDAGCGSGICSEKLARSGARVSAFDITPEMLALARERCAGLDVDIRLGDLEKPLDWLADGSFDRIICSLALDYVERHAGGIRRVSSRCQAWRQIGFLDGPPDARLAGRAHARSENLF